MSDGINFTIGKVSYSYNSKHCRKRKMMVVTKKLLTFALLLCLLPFAACTKNENTEVTHSAQCQGPKGNGAGYGVISLQVPTNQARSFNVVPCGFALPKNPTFSITRAPKRNSVIRFPDGSMESKNSVQAEKQGQYEPEKDFEGLDSFAYQIEGEDVTIDVEVFVDVGPCFKVPEEREAASNTHVIGMRAQSPDVNGPVKITVTAADEPHTIYLVSLEAAKWELTLEDGATIDKVVVASAADVVTGVEPTQIEVASLDHLAGAYKWEPSSNPDIDLLQANFGKFIESVRSREGKSETTYQGCRHGVAFRVPYDAQSASVSCGYNDRTFSHYDFRFQDCEEKCVPKVLGGVDSAAKWLVVNDGFGDPDISADGTVIDSKVYRSAGQTNVGHSCGKHYFELTIESMPSNNSLRKFISLTNALPEKRLAVGFNNRKELDFSNFSVGDVIGVAVNMDQGILAYSRNGNWLEGANPAQSIGRKVDLYTHTPYFFRVYLPNKTRVRTNLGASAMKHTVPEGFRSGWFVE